MKCLFNGTIEINATCGREAEEIFKATYPGIKIEDWEVIREIIYSSNNFPTIEKIRMYDEDNNTFYRFQEPFYEMGNKSWGMIYATEEEALEDGGIVVNGKSCCMNHRYAWQYVDAFDNEALMIIVKGWSLGTGEDQYEDVVDIEEIIEIWNYDDFCKIIKEIEVLQNEDEEEYNYISYQE